MKISLPEQYEMPADAEVGGEFEAVGTFKDNGDGTVTLTQIDGIDIPYGDMGGDGEMEVEIEVSKEPDMMSRAKKAGIDMREMMA